MQLIQSFLGQGPIGYFVIAVIVLISLINILKSKSISKEYERLTSEFNSSEKIKVNEKEELDVKDELLQGIINDFKESAKRGTENINTEVIIQKNLEKGNGIFKKEKTVKSIPSACIALGLLGTFLGLTLAIVQTRGVLGGTMGSTQQFGQAMEAPFSSMSSAFWTSIFGVIASLVLNLCNVNLENKKETFYDEMEDYLDNTIFASYGKLFGNEFERFNTVIRESMLTLTADMRNLFQDGVNELVSKINKNTIDLTSTVEELTNYTKDLDRLTKSLDNSVRNFKEPVEEFKTSIHEYLQTSEYTTKTMKESVDKFSVKVDTLDRDLNNVQNIIKSNREELQNVSQSMNNQLSNSIDTINSSYKKLIEVIELLSKNQDSNNQNLKDQTDELSKVYKDLQGVLSGFLGNLKVAQGEMASTVSTSLENQLESLFNKILSELYIVISKLGESSSELKDSTFQIGELVKETNDLYMNLEKDKMFNS